MRSGYYSTFSLDGEMAPQLIDQLFKVTEYQEHWMLFVGISQGLVQCTITDQTLKDF